MTLDSTDQTALIAAAFGEATPEEQERVKALITIDPRVAAAYAELQQLRQDGEWSYGVQQFSTASALSKVRSRMSDCMDDPTNDRVPDRIRNRAHVGTRDGDTISTRGLLGLRSIARQRPWTTRIAATVLTIGIALAAWANLQVSRETLTRHYATGRGQRARVTLPDGSRVVLAPDSKLRYAADPSGGRTLTLAGRAYFTVAHDPRHPLTIRTGHVSTQVLGTAFDIQRYADDAVMEIVVVDGKVAVRGRGAPVLLTAGTSGQFTDSTARVVTNYDTENADAWTRGRLVFNDIPVRDLLHALHRWYGYEFRLTDSTLAPHQVTVMLPIADTANAMTALKALLGVTMQFDGNVVTLRPARRSPKSSRPIRRWPNQFPSHMEVGK